MTHLFLQQYWWIIISLLGGILSFLLFVQGGQTWLFTIAKNEDERKLLVNSLGRKWEFTFTTLVVFGGASFAAFPLFYATSFGGAYWLWMLLLFSFIIQAISYEYRKKPGNVFGHRTYETLLFINGLAGTFLLGVIVSTFFTGAGFSLTSQHGVIWDNPLRGLEAIANPVNILLGISIFFLARTLGLFYFINNIDHEIILERSFKQLKITSIIFLIFFISYLIIWLTMAGVTYQTGRPDINLLPYRNLLTLLKNPALLLSLLSGILLVLTAIYITLFTHSHKGIWFAGIGTILVVFSILATAGVPGNSFYPSNSHPAFSLTIENASSSFYTLKTMFFVSLIIPGVITYIFYSWRAINREKTNADDLKKSGHNY